MIKAFPELRLRGNGDVMRRVDLDMIGGPVGVGPDAHGHAVGLDVDRTGGQVQRLAEWLAGPERVGAERDTQAAGLEDVTEISIGIVFGEQQEQVAVFDGINTRRDVAVANGHDTAWVFRWGIPDDIVTADVGSL
jgi:hypothetical protein